MTHEKIRALARDRGWLASLYGATSLGRKLLDTLFLDPINIEWATAALSASGRLRRGNFDVVVMEGGLVGGLVARRLRHTQGTAFVDVAHGIDPKWEGAFARNKPDRTVVFTSSFARELGKLAPAASIEVIPHGVDLDAFRPAPEPATPDLERPLFLAIGHVDEHKQFELTLEAVATQPAGSLVVLGGGPAAKALDQLAAHRLGPRRYLRAQISRPELPAWYTSADCFTLASKTESFGLVYLEALACGTPCVAPDDPVRREVIGDAGLFFPASDLTAYAQALTLAATRDWGDVPRLRATRFPFAKTADSYAQLFRDLAR